jgi:hypothetical protein
VQEARRGEANPTPDLDRTAAMRVLGSPTRWRIVQLLVPREACVSDLATTVARDAG